MTSNEITHPHGAIVQPLIEFTCTAPLVYEYGTEVKGELENQRKQSQLNLRDSLIWRITFPVWSMRSVPVPNQYPTAKVFESTAAMASYFLDVRIVLCGVIHDLVKKNSSSFYENEIRGIYKRREMAVEKRERWGRRQREREGNMESLRKGAKKGDRERMRGKEGDTEDKNE